MKTLVTGATGFLGSHLCRRLVKDGHRVTILCRATSNTEPLADLPLTKITGDITDPQAVARALEGQDAVFHAAAHLAYWGREKNAQNQINIEGTRNVVEACRTAGVKKLVYVSSVAAVGIPETAEKPADENFPFNLEGTPLNYHISKKRTEEIVQKAAVAGLDAVIVNPGSIWGPFGRTYRGAEVVAKIRRSRVVPYFTGGISIVHVEDVVDGMMAALEKGRPGERYILCGENISLRKIAELSARAQNLERTFVPLPNPVTWLAAATFEALALVSKKRPPITFVTHYNASRFHYYDAGKARRELGFAPRGFDAILRECVGFMASKNGKSGELSLNSNN